MHESLNHTFDVVLMVLVLAVGLMTGYASLTSTSRALDRWESTYQDKNTSQRFDGSYAIYDEYEKIIFSEYDDSFKFSELLTQGDILIMSQIQDAGMLGSRVVSVDSRETVTTIKGTGGYVPVTITDDTGRAVSFSSLPSQIVTSGRATLSKQLSAPNGALAGGTTEVMTAPTTYTAGIGDTVKVVGTIGSTLSSPYQTSRGKITNPTLYFSGNVIMTTTETGKVEDVDVQPERLDKKTELAATIWNSLRSDSYASVYKLSYDGATEKYIITNSVR